MRRLSLIFDGTHQCSAHEVATLRFAATRIAALLGLEYDAALASPGINGGSYCIPMSTLTRREADALGIQDESQLWGGVVPHDFVATKLVSHRPWRADASLPTGWQELDGIERLTLPGCCVFTADDAWAAGTQLLREGEVRLKQPFARGGNGQAIVRDPSALARWLEAVDGSLEEGLVLERNLVRSSTWSIGSASLPGHEIAYCGQQRTVVDRAGRQGYGGSTLTVFRGPFSVLAGKAPADAVAVALAYDALVRGSYGVLASRRNYDVIIGVDSRGRRHVGVLEQSWRFGGASMAEVIALEWLARHPDRPSVVAETRESYDDAPLPAEAILYGDGDAGSPRKYARIVPDGR